MEYSRSEISLARFSSIKLCAIIHLRSIRRKWESGGSEKEGINGMRRIERDRDIERESVVSNN
jgi:hypothetical protein